MMAGTKEKNKDFKDVNVGLTERDKVAIWEKRIDMGKDFAKKEFWDEAKKDIEFFSGNHYKGIDVGKSRDKDLLTLNYTWSIIKSMIPQTYYQDPYIYLTTNSDEYKDSRQLAEDYLNFCWRKMQIKRQMIKIILDWYVTGLGIRKMGYFTETVRNENLETNQEYSQLVNDEYPYFLRQSPLDVVFDTEAKHLNDRRWMAVKYSVPLNEMKERESLKYKNLDKIDGKYMAGSGTEPTVKGDNIEDKDLKRVELWEIEDYTENRILTISDEVSDKFLKNIENPYFKKCGIKSNYGLLFNNTVPDKLFPQSEVHNLKQPNLEYDKTRTQIMNHKAKAQRKIVYEDGVFTSEDELEKFLNDIDLEPAEVHRDGASKIAVFNASAVDAALYNFCDAMLFDMNNISRQGFNQRAVEAQTEKTATEANIIEKNAQLGNSERLDVVTDFSEDTARDLLAIIQKFPSKEEKFYVERTREMANFKKDDIAGDFNAKIEIGSMTKRNSDADRARAMELFGTLVNLVDIDENGREVLLVNREAMAKRLMEKYGVTETEIAEILKKKPMTPPEVQPGGMAQQGQPMQPGVGEIAQLLGGR
jgi:hypothetical protein